MLIQGFSNYEIFDDGTLFSYISNKFLSCNLKDPLKYKNLVLLDDNGNQVNIYIHQLVARHFVLGYFPGAIVNHKDGKKHNNYHTNLEWVSYSYNNKHAYATGLKIKNDEFKCFAGDIIYPSISELSRQEKISRGCAWCRVTRNLTIRNRTYGLC